MAIDVAALCTLADAQRELGQCDGDDPLQAEMLASVATSMITSFCGRPLHYRTGIVERIAVQASSPAFNLSCWPVQLVTTLEDVFGHPISLDGVEVDLPAGIVRRSRQWLYRGQWAEGIGDTRLVGELPSVVVTYSAGYLTPNQTPVVGAPDLPVVIRWCCTQLIGYLAAQKGSSSSLASESLLSYSVSYGAPESTLGEYSGIPQRLAALLMPFRRTVIM